MMPEFHISMLGLSPEGESYLESLAKARGLTVLEVIQNGIAESARAHAKLKREIDEGAASLERDGAIPGPEAFARLRNNLELKRSVG